MWLQIINVNTLPAKRKDTGMVLSIRESRKSLKE
jgi:hypothetical protein